MNNKFKSSGSIFALVFLGVFTLHAQNRNGSIEDSWERAPKEIKEKPVEQHYQQHETAVQKNSVEPYPIWDKPRSSLSRPWPYIPENPTKKDYFSANSVLIDSLTNLYCLSTNYIKSLSNRNNVGLAPPPPPPTRKDFSYKQSEPPAKGTIQASESLEALYKELLQLLDQCLYGR